MNIIPRRKFTIETNVSPDDIEKNLASIIGNTEYKMNPLKESLPYYGHFNKYSFKMNRVRTLIKNDFFPITNGFIDYLGNVTTIKIKMRLKYSVIIALIFMLVFCFISIFTAPKSFIAGPIGLFLAFYTLTTVVFNYCANKVESTLIDLFEIK